jgi:amino-acid N-acetyltransferase
VAIIIRFARRSDQSDIERLLAKANLNTAGIDKHLDRFIVVENEINNRTRDKKMVGTAGIECWGKDGLLRSLVMESESWNAQVGMDLVKVIMALAKKENLERLFLMTSSSESFFSYLGFNAIDWNDVPTHVKESTQFESYSPETATVMVCERM